MRRIVPLLALALAGAAHAQIAPSPDSPGVGDKSGRTPSTATSPGDTPASPGAGLPSDVRTTPPAEGTQAPPATPADTAPTDAKAKGRAKPSSTGKKPPQS